MVIKCKKCWKHFKSVHFLSEMTKDSQGLISVECPHCKTVNLIDSTPRWKIQQ